MGVGLASCLGGDEEVLISMPISNPLTSDLTTYLNPLNPHTKHLLSLTLLSYPNSPPPNHLRTNISPPCKGRRLWLFGFLVVKRSSENLINEGVELYDK